MTSTCRETVSGAGCYVASCLPFFVKDTIINNKHEIFKIHICIIFIEASYR